MFAIQGDIGGEARVSEREFGIGQCAVSEVTVFLPDDVPFGELQRPRRRPPHAFASNLRSSNAGGLGGGRPVSDSHRARMFSIVSP